MQHVIFLPNHDSSSIVIWISSEDSLSFDMMIPVRAMLPPIDSTPAFIVIATNTFQSKLEKI